MIPIGRSRLAPGARRDNTVQINLSDEELTKFLALVKEEKRSVSAVGRDLILETLSALGHGTEEERR